MLYRVFQIKHQYSFWIIAHHIIQCIVTGFNLEQIFSWPRSSHSVT
jgi:hypothetical protein